ncbi:hypothetical protein AYO47_00970 [Planctomyces sp. SCGC AG-212-M04]|nr:hypothetical protein AYO47_00970 [Planctomyces sp. SCGC AG-212-M04]
MISVEAANSTRRHEVTKKDTKENEVSSIVGHDASLFFLFVTSSCLSAFVSSFTARLEVNSRSRQFAGPLYQITRN